MLTRRQKYALSPPSNLITYCTCTCIGDKMNILLSVSLLICTSIPLFRYTPYIWSIYSFSLFFLEILHTFFITFSRQILYSLWNTMYSILLFFTEPYYFIFILQYYILPCLMIILPFSCEFMNVLPILKGTSKKHILY